LGIENVVERDNILAKEFSKRFSQINRLPPFHVQDLQSGWSVGNVRGTVMAKPIEGSQHTFEVVGLTDQLITTIEIIDLPARRVPLLGQFKCPSR
jgi:hypothetical protein